jgi:Mce-associated membrane protein
MTASENETQPDGDAVVAEVEQHDGDPSVANPAEETSVDAVVAAVPADPSRGARRRKTLLAATLGLLLGSAVAAGSVYWWLFRPEQLTNEAAQQGVIAAAKEGIEAALSYSPENLDNDLATAKSHMTGQFLDYYSDFTKNVVTPAAKEKGVKTEANVARAAVSEMHPDKADVLVFVNQVTTSKSRPTPALATSTVLVTMVRNGDRWLISEFNPV